MRSLKEIIASVPAERRAEVLAHGDELIAEKTARRQVRILTDEEEARVQAGIAKDRPF